MRIGLFEDAAVQQLAPLTCCRPVFDLLCGLGTLGSKQARHFGFGISGLFVRPEVARYGRGRRTQVVYRRA